MADDVLTLELVEPIDMETVDEITMELVDPIDFEVVEDGD